MTTDNKILKEKLAKWAGFKPITSIEQWPNVSTNMPDVVVAWKFPDGNKDYRLPEFYSSLDACFKWLVPKLQSEGFMARVQWSPLYDQETLKKLSDWTGYASVYDVSHTCGIYHFEDWAIAATPALSLCLAIEKLIDAETK